MSHRVAVLALDGVKPFDLGIPGQVLGQVFDAAGEPLYRVATCSLGGRPVATNQDFTLEVLHDESLLARADTVILAAQDFAYLPGPGGLSAELVAALAGIPPTTRIVSLCTAAFVLAAAGLLDGRTATTHWAVCGELARSFPLVDVDQGVLFVDSGRVLTSAGAAAGIDLCLHLVRSDYGTAAANAAARRSVVAPWREGGQRQFVERSVPEHADASTSATRAWALEQLAEPLTLAAMAGHAHMSVRTFTRRFREEVGQSPQRWLALQRVDRARQLLESTDLRVDEVARAAGFVKPIVLRKHLHASVGLSPVAYRRAFSASRSAHSELAS